jgi:hypothetical protein
MNRRQQKQKSSNSSEVGNSNFGPAIPYRIDLRLTDAQRAALFKEPTLVVVDEVG